MTKGQDSAPLALVDVDDVEEDERRASNALAATSDGLAIRTSGLTKHFGDAAVVDDLELQVPEGAVYGFLGPNGSGKTTTIRMLLGLIAADAGEIRLLGEAVPQRVDRALPHVGALVEGPAFYPWLSGRQNLARLDLAGPDQQRATRARRIATALERVGLTAAAGKRYSAYSLGMRQRLGLANALLRPRQLLVLDEPTNGMDPQGTREIRNLIRQLASDGATIFLSTHLLAEVEQICTHVGIMSLGRLVMQGSLDDLRRTSPVELHVETPDAELAATVLSGCGLADPVVAPDGVVVPVSASSGERPEDLCAALVCAGVAVRGFSVERPTLEDRFVELTGEGFDVAR
jgi:ABC-2 type transport system ATP-binding protein